MKRIVIFDIDPPSRAALTGRVQLACRQAELRKVELVSVDFEQLSSVDAKEVIACLIGPGCYDEVDEVLERIKAYFPQLEIGVVLENEVYANQAVSIRKRLNLRIMPLGDLAQIASFLIDAENQSLETPKEESLGIVGVAQLKGGVGATTLVSSFAAAWARHGVTVAAIDLDDVNPQLTEWARVGPQQRTVTSEFLRKGNILGKRMNELLHPVESFEGRLVVVGQPERYNEGFHFKADVLENAPSSADFVRQVVMLLKAEFEVVILDLGRSWGVSTFAALPLCQHVLLVTDDDGMSVRRTLDGLQRLVRESDDPDEFNLKRWSLVLNAYTGKLLSPKDLAAEIREMDLLPAESTLYTVPFSETGRQWGAPGQTFYDLADTNTRMVITRVASNLMPFRYAEDFESSLGKVVKKIKAGWKK